MEEKEQRFKEFKARVLEAAHEAKACILSYRDAYNTEGFENLCDVIKDNFWWCCRRGVVIAIDSAIVKAHGWSSVYAFELSTVIGYGSVVIEAYGQSTVKCSIETTCNVYDDAIVYRWDEKFIETVSPDIELSRN